MRVKIREVIYNAIREVSNYKTLEPHTGFAVYMNSEEIKPPCAWLCPLELSSVTGRSEGVKTYSGVIYLMELIEGLTANQKDEAWDRMEMAAMEILTNITDLKIGLLGAENIRCQPDEYALTGYNTISIVVRFDVKIKYCG